MVAMKQAKEAGNTSGVRFIIFLFAFIDEIISLLIKN